MGFLTDLLASVTASAVKAIRGATREKVAAVYEDIARRIREGDLIPEEAFEQFAEDQAELDEAYSKLPD